MFANDFAQYGTIIARALQVAATDPKHRTGAARVPRNTVIGRAAKNAGRITGLVALHSAARDPHDAGFGVVCA